MANQEKAPKRKEVTIERSGDEINVYFNGKRFDLQAGEKSCTYKKDERGNYYVASVTT